MKIDLRTFCFRNITEGRPIVGQMLFVVPITAYHSPQITMTMKSLLSLVVFALAFASVQAFAGYTPVLSQSTQVRARDYRRKK
jgi:hypothetical protein